jgi:hypothetical protein
VTKPVLDGESRYEDHPINWKPENGYFDSYDVRQALYWAILSGACGHTYGNHNVWQFWEPKRQAISAAHTPWREALEQPGAFQMGYARHLFDDRPFDKLAPEQSMILSDVGRGADTIIAARATDGSYALVYLPTGSPVDVSLEAINSVRVRASWFDPRKGEATTIGEFPNTGGHRFKPTAVGRGHDMLLILDAMK